MVTFGEMASLAHQQLTEVRSFLHHPDFGAQAVHPDTIAEVARLCRVLGRYTDRIATGFGVPYTDGSGVRDAARRTSVLLRDAGEALGAPPDSELNGPSLSQLLRATSTALGCGLDLLSTHFTAAARAAETPLTPTASVIAATDTARSLLRMLSEYASVVGHVALRASPAAQPAALSLIKAALITHCYGQADDGGIAAIPIRDVPDRVRPQEGEDLHQALAGIDASIRRLNAVEEPSSVATWRYLARAAAVTTGISQCLVGTLSVRAEQLGDRETSANLTRAARSLERVAERWKAIARRWHDLAAMHHDPVSTASVDASDLLLRLGRLTYADPSWTPTHRSRFAPAPPERLAPSLREVRLIGLAALKSIETYNTIAAQHQAAVNDIAMRGPRRGPGSSRQPRELSNMYKNVQVAGQRVLARLGRALHDLTPTDETALALRRAAAPAPAALASKDFPRPITEALQAAPSPAPQAHTSTRTTSYLPRPSSQST
ncbi:hypothetical protein GCM10009678_66450 [Actinomadura kijaniata]|uniref:Uncharacterized protein n=1 Tax=Actinomadura namibiensis TaxID=182080 RepID=A0A7W3QRE6_ACTNM|nr:hypothetical protein [Actinomadura namibiensis]MBA8956547.1 hypothetical protein [Actinomadura namibiensis]